MNISDITVRQIEDMKHCIGFSKNRVTGTKHRVMYAYRNYYCDHQNNEGWNSMVEIGLAYKERPDKYGLTYFHLTKEGLKFLANLCGFEEIEIE